MECQLKLRKVTHQDSPFLPQTKKINILSLGYEVFRQIIPNLLSAVFVTSVTLITATPALARDNQYQKTISPAITVHPPKSTTVSWKKL